MEDIIDIIVTETTNTIEITAQPNDEIIDVNIIDNREDIVLNVTPTVVEVNINTLTGNFGVFWGDIEGTLSNQTDLNTALGLKADLVGGKVPASQLPSYVDDVVEVANYAALPATGETGKIYVTIDTNYIYRWTGSVYVEIKDSSAVWGAITGSLSSQTDLQNALNAKEGTITAGTTAQYWRGDKSFQTLNTTVVPEGTNLYFTNARVSANTDVAANTAARHNAVTLGTANGLSLSTQILSLGLSSSSANGALSSTDWTTFNAKQPALSGSGIVKSTSGTISYLTDNTANWDVAYNDKINSASVTGTTTKTLTLTQQDGGTVTASWTDINTDAVSSVFGRTGAVVATSGDYTTTQVTEGTNLYYTDARARASVSAGTGISYNSSTGVITNTITQYTDALARASLSFSAGSGAYNSTTGVITIPTNTNQLTNGASFITLTSLSAGTGISYNNTTGVIASTITQYTDALARLAISGGTGISYNNTTGVITNTITQYTDAMARASLSFTAGSGAYNSTTGIITIPTNTNQLTNGASFITLASLSGTSPISYNNTTGAISISQASGSANGFLSSTDWTTFNNKQAALNGTGFVKISGTTISYDNSTYLTTSSASSTYLPLVGGTLTGGLNGTSATFSSNFYVSGGTNTNSGNGIHAYYESSYAQIQLNGASGSIIDFSTSGTDYLGRIIYTNATNTFEFKNNVGTSIFTLASTGAATFSSSVTATSLLTTSMSGSAINIRGDETLNSNYGITWTTPTYTGGIAAIRVARTGSTDAANMMFFVAPNGDIPTERMRITSVGNVGIGTTAPDYKFTVSAAASNYVSIDNTSNNYRLLLGAESAGTALYSRNLSTNAAVDMRFVVGTSEAMRITSGGDVGIGTSSPQYKLDVNGNGRYQFRNASSEIMDLAITTSPSASTSNISLLWYGNETASLRFIRGDNSTGGKIAFWTQIEGGSITERMRITSGGNVLIGTTTDSGYRLTLSGDARVSGTVFSGGNFEMSGAWSNSPFANSNWLRASSGAGIFLVNYSVTAHVGLKTDGTFSASGSGTFGGSVTATSFFESSDKTIKTLIEDNYEVKGIENVTAKLYIKDGKEELGYFAQDVQNILPSAVSVGDSNLLTLSYREVLVAKVQRTETEIDKLKRRVSELEQQLNLN